MSVHYFCQYTLRCDAPACAEILEGTNCRLEDLRKAARRRGWSYGPGKVRERWGTYDFCPVHALLHDAAARRRQVYELRRNGANFEDIAAQVGGTTVPHLKRMYAKAAAEERERLHAEAKRVTHRERMLAFIPVALPHLDEREGRVFAARLGVPDPERFTLEAIARDMGVSRERVRRIEMDARRKLRAAGILTSAVDDSLYVP